MDVLEEELLKFWKALNDHHVRYIMVGGFVTRFHGFNRSGGRQRLLSVTDWLFSAPASGS